VLATCTGVGLVTLACALPGVGAYVFSIANLFGLGAVLLTRMMDPGNRGG